MPFVDNYETKIPVAYLKLLLNLGQEYEFDPTSSTEMENYFVSLLRSPPVATDKLESWLRKKVEEDFQWLKSKPSWIQNPNWQVNANGPMLFVGQIDCPATQKVFYVDVSFFVFFDVNNGEIRTVLQIA